MKSYTKEQEKNVIDLYQSGKTSIQVSDETGIGRTTVLTILKINNIERRPSGGHLTKKEKDEIIKLKKDGKTIQQISNLKKRSTVTINRVLKGNGMTRKIKEKIEVSKENREKALNLYIEKQMSPNEIIEEFKKENLVITLSIIHNELRKAGYERPTGYGKFDKSPEIKQDIITRYNNGQPLNLIASFYKCSEDPIKRILTQAGIQIRDWNETCGLKWKNKAGKEFIFKSMYEVKYAKWRDQQGLTFEYEKQGFDLSDGTKYYPDFWDYDKDGNFERITELKGFLRENSKVKIELFRKEYSDIPYRLIEKEEFLASDYDKITFESDEINKGDSYELSMLRISNETRIKIVNDYLNFVPITELEKKYKYWAEGITKLLKLLKVWRSKTETRKFNAASPKNAVKWLKCPKMVNQLSLLLITLKWAIIWLKMS